MKKNYFLKLSLSLAFYFSAISIFAQTTYSDGIFVLNEGGADGASISFISSASQVQNNIYTVANPTAPNMGTIGQSMSFHGDYAYIVLNMSNSIRVVNRYTMELVATINTGLSNPRYMAFVGNKGYVTNWGANFGDAGFLATIDLATNTVESSVALSSGQEKILNIDDKLYIAHKGGLGQNDKLTIFDPISLTSNALTVGDIPNSMVESEGYLYVLSEGNPYWAPPETDGKLVKINLTTAEVTEVMTFPGQHPSNLKIDGDYFYFSIDADVYKIALNATSMPTTPLFSLAPQGVYGLYGMDIIDNKIYAADAGNYSSPGKAYVYSTAGALLNDFTVGVIPNSFYKAVEENLSVDKNSIVKISLYPNPASDVFYINTTENATVTLYDISGRLVKTQNYTASGISIAALNTGIYMAEITIGTDKEFKKIIKK